jgi:hypothetical protein
MAPVHEAAACCTGVMRYWGSSNDILIYCTIMSSLANESFRILKLNGFAGYTNYDKQNLTLTTSLQKT